MHIGRGKLLDWARRVVCIISLAAKLSREFVDRAGVVQQMGALPRHLLDFLLQDSLESHTMCIGLRRGAQVGPMCNSCCENCSNRRLAWADQTKSGASACKAFQLQGVVALSTQYLNVLAG